MKKRFSPLAALFFLALIAFNPPPLAAQSPPNAWHTYNRFDGLPGSWFFDITQTSDGAVWVASDEGVARFNGVWQTFTEDPRAPTGSMMRVSPTEAVRLTLAAADIIPEAVQDAELAYAQIGSSQEYTDRHFRRDLRRLVPALQEACPGQPRLIFLLDEADVLNVYDPLTQQQFRRILQDSSTQDIGDLLAGVAINKSWDRQESPWYNMFIEVPIAALSRIEAEQLIREPVAGFYEWNDAAIRRIWQKSQGHPHRIQQICLEAVNIMLDHERHRLTLADVEKVDERVLRAEHS